MGDGELRKDAAGSGKREPARGKGEAARTVSGGVKVKNENVPWPRSLQILSSVWYVRLAVVVCVPPYQ